MRRRSFYLLGSVMLAGLLSLAAGPGSGAPAKSAKPKAGKGKTTPAMGAKPKAGTAAKGKPAAGKTAPKEEPELRLDDLPQIAALNKQLEGGPGVLVCEPVGNKVDAELADFGAGCGRWLHLMVGGQPEFGRTPLWSWTDRARKELKKPNFRLTLEEALLAARKLALTHVAVGEIEGSAEKLTLTYRLVAVAGKKTLGESFTTTGSREEVTAALGSTAGQMVRRLGVPVPRVPAAPGETAAELTALGRLPWVPDERISDAEIANLDQAVLLALGYRGAVQRPNRPVLGVFLASMYMGSIEESGRLLSCASALRDHLPDCTLALGEVAKQAYFGKVASRQRLTTPSLAPLLEKHPHNFALRVAETYLHRLPGQDLQQARKSAELAVQCATRVPDAWLMLEGVIGQQAQAIRRGRFITDMTEEELEQCTALYAQQLPLDFKAVELGPDYPTAWRILSGAAAFLGEGELADSACERALALDARDYGAVSWAVQLYQPKWIDDPNKLSRAGKLAIQAADGWSSYERLRLAVNLHHADLPDLAVKVLRTDPERKQYDDHVKSHR